MYFSGITNGNNKTIVSFNAYKDTGYEKYDFGATFINSYPMTSGMLYITKDCDWFVVSLSIGAYKFNNRSASYSGAYLSHNYNSGYFGFGMADIIDVGFKNGTEDDFFYFDARTPQVFAFQKIIDLYDFSMGVAVNGSHHRIEKWNYKAAIEFGYKDQNVGVGYSKYGNVLIYAKASVGIVEVFIALDRELSMGIGLDF